MSSYIIKFTNTSGESGTMIADAGFNYTEKLNAINDANIKITGSSTLKRSLVETGSQVFITRNGTLEHHGLVNSVDFLDGGGISVLSQGYETWMAKENGDYAGSPWDNTASATIFTSTIGESNYFTAGTIEAGTNIDFRAYETDSLWNTIMNLRTKTSQDIGIDYTNTEIDILDHKGSSTSVATFNNGIQITNMRVSQSYPLGNDVRVYGKGDGENQIKSDSSTAGQDATSKSTYGIIRKIVRDPSVLTIDEADLLADALVAIYKDPVKIYDFDVINTNQSVVAGDVITLNAPSQGLDNEEVRIVRLERGVRNGNEYLTLQVTNKEYSLLLKNRNEVIAEIEKNARDQQTYMQGTTNVLTFSQQINATSTAPLRTQGNLPASFIEDEAGNLRVNSFTCDYDVDPYRRGVGDASEQDENPSVNGSSEGQGASVNGSSGNAAPSVNGSSSSDTAIVTITSTSFSSVSCSAGSWTNVALRTNANVNPYYSTDLLANFSLRESSGGPEDVYIRIYNTLLSYPVFTMYVENFGSGSSESEQIAINTTGVSFLTGTGTQYLILQVKPITGAISVSGDFEIDALFHSHDDGTYAANSHPHDDGTYAAASHTHADGSYAAELHNHSVAVGDAVSDAGSINATEVDIYVDHWSGSAWVQKHSILNTGKTLDTDVDISNSGTLPDAAGYWRTRIVTDNATADLVNSIMKVKHELDT